MNIYKELPEIEVQFFQKDNSKPNIDHQGIQWTFIEERSDQLQKRARISPQFHSNVYKKRNIFASSKPIYKDQFYNIHGFHKVPDTKEAHFQSKYTLVKPQIPNILIHSQFDKLIVYDKFQQYFKRFHLCRPGFESIGIASLNNRIVVAGMSANLIIIDMESGLQYYNEIVGENQFINHAFLYDHFLVTCDNAKKLKIYDLDKSSQQPIYCYKDQANVNLACVSSEKLIGFCGDRLGVSVLDPKSNKLVHNLMHHTDYAFCVDFNPIKPYELASGSEDQSCLIYDLRNTQTPLQQIQSTYAIYNLQYTAGGEYLIVGESQDYLHIVDKTYQHMQTVTFLGKQTGIAIDYDDLNTFYFSVDNRQHSGIFEMKL